MKFWIPVLLVTAAAACAGDPSEPPPSGVAKVDSARIALDLLGGRTYLGFQGGLYPNGANELPAAHASRGLQQARMIQPLDPQGRASPAGKYVLLSIGMSNTTQEFCAQAGTRCDPWTFTGQALADPSVNRTSLVIANGASGGQVAEAWDAPTDDNYRRVRDDVLTPAGLSEAQVQIVWLKIARSNPTASLPSPAADAYLLHQLSGSILRTLKTRYPNLRQVFLSSRIFAGYATTRLNPEPYAYEGGFAAKWLIESQIRQLDQGMIDPRAGALGLDLAPWVAWGPYLWGGRGNFNWVPADFQSDGTHPSQSGETKVGAALLQFFKTSPQTNCWFLAGRSCS